MLKLMIVDDEMLCRKGIKTCVYWPSYGIQIVAEAENGKEALEKVAEYHPDIVITDIKMPVMDGIELSKRLRNQYPNIALIVLSAYAEFEYARAALQLQLDDYLLRPFGAEELIKCILKVKEKIDKNNRNKQQSDKIQCCLETYSVSMRSQLLKRLLEGQTISEEEMDSQNTVLGISFPRSSYYLLVIDFDLYDLKTVNVSMREWNQRSLEMLKFLEELLKSVKYSICFQIHEKQIGIIYPVDGFEHSRILQRVSNLQNLLMERFEQSFCILISDVSCGTERLSEAFQEIRMLLEKKAYSSPGSILIYQESRNQQVISIHCAEEKKMLAAVKELDFEALSRLWKEFSLYFQKNPGKMAEIQSFCCNLLFKIWDILESHGYLMADWVSQESVDYSQIIFRLEFLSNILDEYMPEVFQKIYDFVLSEKKSQKEYIISTAVDYLEQHYGEEISLDIVAQACYVSPSHLSRLFTKNMGISFTNWLNQYRIEQAKTFLKGSERYNVSEIAHLVGFKDYKYFSFVFKKLVGCLPSEFKSKFIERAQ